MNDHTPNLDALTTQRDRLAAALREIQDALNASSDPIAQSAWWMAMDRRTDAALSENP